MSMRLYYRLAILILAIFLISNTTHVEGETTCTPSWNTQEIITEDGIFSGVDTNICGQHCYVVQITDSVESIKFNFTGQCMIKLLPIGESPMKLILYQNMTRTQTYTDPTPGNFIVLINGYYTMMVNYTYKSEFQSGFDIFQILIISGTVGSLFIIIVFVLLIIRNKK